MQCVNERFHCLTVYSTSELLHMARKLSIGFMHREFPGHSNISILFSENFDLF